MSSEINAEIVEVCDSLENVTISNEVTSNDEDKEILKSIEESLQCKDDDNTEDKLENATTVKKTEVDLLEIVNSMEADRKKFIEHVRSKISNQEKEFKVLVLISLTMKISHFGL